MILCRSVFKIRYTELASLKDTEVESSICCTPGVPAHRAPWRLSKSFHQRHRVVFWKSRLPFYSGPKEKPRWCPADQSIFFSIAFWCLTVPPTPLVDDKCFALRIQPTPPVNWIMMNDMKNQKVSADVFSKTVSICADRKESCANTFNLLWANGWSQPDLPGHFPYGSIFRPGIDKPGYERRSPFAYKVNDRAPL